MNIEGIEGVDVKAIKAKLSKILGVFSKYGFVLIAAFILGLFVVIFYRINHYSNLEPTADMLEEQLRASTRPRIDQNSIDRLQQLQSENIQVQTLFNEARENPFSE